jgi:AraC-like DNA-binding protein
LIAERAKVSKSLETKFKMGSRLDRITDWALEARQNGYNARELAFAHKVSLRQLQRHFQELFKASPKQWLNDLRIAQARQEMLSRPRAIKELAADLGFKHPSHFCREFKKSTGMSATDFLKQHPAL